jgi:GNAT superfamily N-acetyltransferase
MTIAFEILDIPPRPADLPREAWPEWDWTWAYAGRAELGQAWHFENKGNSDDADTLDMILVHATESQYQRAWRFVAALPGGRTPADVVGLGGVWIETEGDATNEASISVLVRPEGRRQGIGAALFAHAEQIIRDQGATVVTAGTLEVPEPSPGPDTMTAKTGQGRVTASSEPSRFALARGFELGQVVRYSQLDVPDDFTDLRARRDEALAAAGPDYVLHVWDSAVDPRVVPDAFRADAAALFQAQSLEMPSGELEVSEELWDEGRLDEYLDEMVEDGSRVVYAAIEYVGGSPKPEGQPTERLVAFTEVVANANEVSGWQGDMLVLPGHRGHRLGLLVFSEALLHLLSAVPTLKRIIAWNAEENAPALAITNACGFRPAGVDAVWQRKHPA